MMQHRPEGTRRDPQRGVETWLPPLLIAAANFALVVALIWFVVVAGSLRGRIPVPPWLIPLAIVAAAGVAVHLLLRGIRCLRIAIRGWRGRFEPLDRR